MHFKIAELLPSCDMSFLHNRDIYVNFCGNFRLSKVLSLSSNDDGKLRLLFQTEKYLVRQKITSIVKFNSIAAFKALVCAATVSLRFRFVRASAHGFLYFYFWIA